MLNVAVLVKFFNGEISPFDESAIACALQMDNSKVTVLSMSPLSDRERLEYYTRYNINCILVSDKDFAGSDTLATSKILTCALKRVNPDLIICGRQSLNGDTAQVPAEISQMLGYNFYPYVTDYDGKNISTRLGSFELKFPCVVSVERIKNLQPPSIFSKKSEIQVFDNSLLNLPKSEVGFLGSPTKVIKTYEKEKKSKRCKLISFDELENVIKKSLCANEKKNELSENLDKFDLVHYVDDSVNDIAKKLSYKAVKIEDLNTDILKTDIKVLLFPANLKYRAIAPKIAAKLNMGLSADCIKLYKKDDRLVMVRPALSGNTIAEIVSDSRIQLATVRVNQKSDEVVFCIGYGAKDYIDKIKDLAKKFNAEIVSTRKCVDNGIMPYDCQVGLTGKIISPKVYVAFGVSGAVQHMVGVENAQTIIAINKDKNEKIFDYVDYGIIKEL